MSVLLTKKAIILTDEAIAPKAPNNILVFFSKNYYLCDSN